MLSSRKSLNKLKCFAEDVKDAIDESPLPPVPPDSLCDNGKIIIQGVVTLIGPVEPFATGIKMKSSDQEAIYTKIKRSRSVSNSESRSLAERFKANPNIYMGFLIEHQAIKGLCLVGSRDQGKF